ncbi:MAG TPA: glycine zipper 2TM domain-containing protein [Chiayiivirga sp.]|nr:glycine zipper 2TM domain-containing protein [Chiayiivirga sp.]
MFTRPSSRLRAVTALSIGLLLAACQPSQAPSTPNAAPETSTAAPVAPTDVAPVAGSDGAQVTDPTLAVEAPLAPPAPPAAPTTAPPAPPAPPAPAPVPPKPVAQATGEQYATVVSVTPVRRSVDNPQEVCRDVEVAERVEPKDDKQIAGAVIGAVAGAVIGNQIGDGHGRDAARVAGAVAGAVAGRKIQENQQNKKTQTRVERQCETVNDPRYETYAYDIVYSYAGQNHQARVAEDPGARIKLPVRSVE